MKARKAEKKVASRLLANNNRRHFFAMAFLFAAIFLVYSNSLNGTWAMDDVFAKKWPGMQDIRHILGFRNLTYLTFLLNQKIAPFTSASFRLFNILLHFLNAVLIYVLAYKTMLIRYGDAGRQDIKKAGNDENVEDRAFTVALISSSIFALHPLNINAVAYIIQRMASLATFFVLLSLLSYIAAARSSGLTKAVFFYAVSTAFLIAGIFSKENAIMAVPLILLYDHMFISRGDPGLFRKKALVSMALGLTGIGLASYLLSFYSTFTDLVSLLSNFNKPLAERAWMAVDVYWTPLQHVLTEFRVLSRYIFLIFAPLPRFLIFDWWGYPVSTGITEPEATMFSAAFIVSLFVFSIWMRKRFPLICFGILWYLIAISMESFLAVGSDLYFEHRNYLPLAGLIIGMVGQVGMSSRIKERVIMAGALVLCLMLGSLTFARNFVWKDSETLWTDSLNKNPSNIRAMISLGNTYLKLSDTDDAEKYFKEAMKTSAKNKRAYYLNESAYSLGMIYLFKGELEQAKNLIDGLDIVIGSYKPRILKAFYKSLNGDLDESIKEFNEVLRETTGDVEIAVVNTLLGDAYRAKGMWDTSIDAYTRALSVDPGFAAAYYGMGVAYMSKRSVALAYDCFSKTLELEPDNSLALSDMADLMLITGRKPEDALPYAQRAVSKSPFFYQPYLTMGNVLTILKREKEAVEFYNKAVEHRMPEYMVPLNRARAYYLRGDREKAGYYLSELRRYKDLPENIRPIVRN